MCGIVAYFGGAGNNLTRLLTGMSAIIYRAPDSTGIGLFGDDREPIRLRKSLGSVVQLLDALRTDTVYSRREAMLLRALGLAMDGDDVARQQRCLLGFEGFDSPPDGFQPDPPDFDELVDLESEPAARLVPGSIGRLAQHPGYRIRSRRDLSTLIGSLITAYDLSPLAIQTLVRGALAETVCRRRQQGAVVASDADILSAFDEVFEATHAGARIQRLRHRPPDQMPKPPNALKELWQCLVETTVRIPEDYDRDGVGCLFRLLDGALLSRLAGDPALVEALDRSLDALWPSSDGAQPVDWRTLYAVEKSLNVYGWAGAAALSLLREGHFSSFPGADSKIEVPPTAPIFVQGGTDPQLLRFLATPIIAHGRWAMQSAVTVENAHPFMDARRQRAIALNGQFDSRVEARLRDFLETVGNYRLRSENSAEYAALLWGHFYDELRYEQRRSDRVHQQVEQDMADISICSQSIDFNVYHRVRNRTPIALDQMAFVAAARQIVQNGGQIAIAGISLISPRCLFVASHNRPVFVVRRLENDDFMVVSDINAALGLFPQQLIEETIQALDKRHQRSVTTVSEDNGQRADPKRLRSAKEAIRRERDRLLDRFAVEVFPLDGEEIVARIETEVSEGRVRRKVTVSDFDGNAMPDLESFETRLDPVTVRKDVNRSFHESHLREVPERFRYILDAYYPAAFRGGPTIDLNSRRLRRRFGRRLEGLRRLVLVGTGSAYHMAVIARTFLSNLLPETAIDVVRPAEVTDPRRQILSEQDLVVMASWSSTTAEMVQLAHQLVGDGILLMGVTEKGFADMALAARKSVGVMPVFSGEEVTISGIKSTLCMLLCLEILGTWICAEKEMSDRLGPVFRRLDSLADRIDQLNGDQGVAASCREIAAPIAAADAIAVVGAPANAGIGKEIALKLEEAAWYTVSRWYGFDDILASDPRQWSGNRFVIVHATNRAHIDTALAVVEKLADAGLNVGVVTCPNRHQDRFDQLTGNRSMVLPCHGDGSEPYLDLVFAYQLALQVGFAAGHGVGVGPRNRTKSSTVTRSRPKAVLSPTAELRRLAMTVPTVTDTLKETEDSQISLWEDRFEGAADAKIFAGFRQLADCLRQDDPLAALADRDDESIDQLGRYLFDERSEVSRMVMASLDADAQGVAKDVSAIWRRLVQLPIRELPTGEYPCHMAEDTLLMVLSAATDTAIPSGEIQQPDAESKVAWIGPELPFRLTGIDAPAGRFVLQMFGRDCFPSRLYAGLHLLLAEAWSRHEQKKGATVRRHIAAAADVLFAVLNDARLFDEIRDVAKANANYRTGFFISPSTMGGRFWEKQFDRCGGPMMVHHLPGHSAHGPIVTIDGNAGEKYITLTRRAAMVDRFGEREVAKWESLFLSDMSVDRFLADLPDLSARRPKAPFFADNQWHLPVLLPDYDTRRDNLIVLDMTGERDLPVMLDELSLVGSRLPRLVILTQEGRIREIGEKTLLAFPVSNLVVLPAVDGRPISDLHLPLVLLAIGAALAVAWYV